MTPGDDGRLGEAVGAASVAGSYRTWARLQPQYAQALEQKAEEFSALASTLLAEWLAGRKTVDETHKPRVRGDRV